MINKGGGFPFVGSSRLLLRLCESQELSVSTVIVHFQDSTMVWVHITSHPEAAASFLYIGMFCSQGNSGLMTGYV